mmetsp:Transcript_43916/g.99315  ORF Transcript_43916/g.99315 Transcript_43916/m.99315 type:complete len:224 (+) Transcript_43916:307-978(+)
MHTRQGAHAIGIWRLAAPSTKKRPSDPPPTRGSERIPSLGPIRSHPIPHRSGGRISHRISILVGDDELRQSGDHLHGLALRGIEATGAHPGDDLSRAEAKAVGVDGDVLQGPERTELGAVEGVVYHEVVHQQPSARLEGLEGVGIELLDNGLRDGSRDVRHEDDVEGGIVHRPVRGSRVKLNELHTLLHARRHGLLDALTSAADLRQLKHRRRQLRSRVGEDV